MMNGSGKEWFLLKKIRKIEPALPALAGRKKVAAYARVSRDTERLMNSVSAQISHYSALIQNNPEWEYAGVYADCGISGTGTARRGEFLRMLGDCEAGRINIILTKSISRFARNTVDLLETVRHLKSLGIEVRFEKKDFYTGKVPKNAVKSAVFGNYWCLGGV